MAPDRRKAGPNEAARKVREVWVAENSTVFRTPYQYSGGYVDEVRKLENFGDRWYDVGWEMLYSPDPVLTSDPMAIVDGPTLAAAYAFAGSNPLKYVDPSGRQFTQAYGKAFVKDNFDAARAMVAGSSNLQAAIAGSLKTRLPKSFVKMGLNLKEAELRQKKFEAIDDIAKPFVSINVSTGEVTLSPGLFVEKTFKGDEQPPDPAIISRLGQAFSREPLSLPASGTS